MDKKFVHLHVHTHHSQLDGLIKPDDLFERCKELGHNTIAVTNHGNLFNILEYVNGGLKKGIKVIPGIESYMTWSCSHTSKGVEFDERFHVVLLAMNLTGYKNLLKLSTAAYLEGFYHKPRIDFNLLSKYHEGIIVLSACLHGVIPQKIINNQTLTEARKIVANFKEVFGDRFYLEVQHQPDIFEQEVVNKAIMKIAKDENIKVVATCDSHYSKEEHFEAWKAIMMLSSNNQLGVGMPNNFWLKSYEELEPHFPREVIEETVNVAARCEQIVIPKEYKFPHIDLKGNTAQGLMTELATQGLEDFLRSKKFNDRREKEYRDRLSFELGVLEKTGFAPYILIVGDYVNWAKNNDIAVGPARGSAAGSIVCYSMGITDIDPLEYDLLFERFINPDRIGEIDFKKITKELIKNKDNLTNEQLLDIIES